MNLLLTPRSKKSIAKAGGFARELGHAYIGPDHILVALFQVDSCRIRKMMELSGVDYDDFSLKIKCAAEAIKSASL